MPKKPHYIVQVKIGRYWQLVKEGECGGMYSSSIDAKDDARRYHAEDGGLYRVREARLGKTIFIVGSVK